MTNLTTWAVRLIIIMLVFPVLVLVLSGGFQLLAHLVESTAPDDAYWKDRLIPMLHLAGLLVGFLGSGFLCWKMWRLVGAKSGERAGESGDDAASPGANGD